MVHRLLSLRENFNTQPCLFKGKVKLIEELFSRAFGVYFRDNLAADPAIKDNLL